MPERAECNRVHAILGAVGPLHIMAPEIGLLYSAIGRAVGDLGLFAIILSESATSGMRRTLPR